MVSDYLVSVVLPCHNEEAGLIRIFAAMPSCVDEVVVVDNCSEDGSVGVARKYGAIIVTETELGYGKALLKGLETATCDYIVIMDADGSYPVLDIEGIIGWMNEENLDFVSCSRFPLVDRRAMPFIKIICNHLISFLIRRLFALDISDSQSGMMIVRREFLGRIKPCATGMGFSQEMKIRAWFESQQSFAEVSISYSARIGRVKFRGIRDGIMVLFDAFFLKFTIKTR